jgi:hypothetical protein
MDEYKMEIFTYGHSYHTTSLSNQRKQLWFWSLFELTYLPYQQHLHVWDCQREFMKKIMKTTYSLYEITLEAYFHRLTVIAYENSL